MKYFHALFPVFWGMWVSVGSSKRTGAVLRVQLLLLETVSHEKITQRPPAHQYTSLYSITAWKKSIVVTGEGLSRKIHSNCPTKMLTIMHYNGSLRGKSFQRF